MFVALVSDDDELASAFPVEQFSPWRLRQMGQRASSRRGLFEEISLFTWTHGAETSRSTARRRFE
jgi:hypothetical protein